MKKSLHFIIFFLAILSIFSPSYLLANEVENRIKAAFLYKFCGYVTWPDGVFSSLDDPIVIGVVGGDVLLSDIRQTVSSRSVNNRSFVVRSVQSEDSVANVHILYVAKDSKRSIEDYINPDETPPILTVSDNEKSSLLSVINFVVVNQRVRFQISNQRANEIGLKLSSQLLSIALQVDGGQP